MNIFILDQDPLVCAQMHCDKHVVKMILETAQLLSSAHHMTGNADVTYKLTHKNHPSAVWARASMMNYAWLYDLFIALLAEYEYRYNRRHACERLIDELSIVPDIAAIDQTDFALAMPDEFKTNDAVQSYRNYYLGAKQSMLKYTKRSIPEWIK